jgi:hypothetical protein
MSGTCTEGAAPAGFGRCGGGAVLVGRFRKPRSAGPRGGDLALRLCHFMLAKSARHIGSALVAAKSPGRGCGPALRGGLTPSIPRLVRGPRDALLCKAARHRAREIYGSYNDRGRKKPRIAGPRGGDPTGGLCALWRPSPNEIEAMRRLQPNRRAEGAAQRCAAG